MVASLGEDGSKVSRSAKLKLPSHDPPDELEDGDLDINSLQRVSSLEAEDTTTDDDSIGIALVLDREDALEVVARKRRDKHALPTVTMSLSYLMVSPPLVVSSSFRVGIAVTAPSLKSIFTSLYPSCG